MSKEKDTIIKVLIVDDNVVNTLILANMLELFGIYADNAYSGKSAIKMAKKEGYDLIFIDHLMPEMDGVQTTKNIINESKETNKIVIYALTSSVTAKIKSIYHEVGAKDVYAKPLGISELIDILRQFPQVAIEAVISQENTHSSLKEDLLKSILEETNEINYCEGLKNARGNSVDYIQILKAVLEDIQKSSNLITKSRRKGTIEELRIGVHNLKSVFSNIGAIRLLAETKFVETILAKGDFGYTNEHLSYYINQIERFKVKLKMALDKYELMMSLIAHQEEKVYLPMIEMEYEQCLTNTIYYIKRFEYDSIINGIERLIHAGHHDLKIEFMKALEEIKEFNYEEGLNRIVRIKNEIDKNT